MKEIFLGFFFDKKKEEELRGACKTGISMAVNQYQEGFLKGLNRKIDIVSATAIKAFSKTNHRLIFNRDSAETEYGHIVYLPFINFYFIREMFFEIEAYKELKKRLSKNEMNVIYVYSLDISFLKVIKKLKKENENVHCCLIITDLPGSKGFLANSKTLSGYRDRAEERIKYKLSHVADSYVFLTEKMKDSFPDRPYVVIEGFLPTCSFPKNVKRQPKSILYTGSLHKSLGVDRLLEAFKGINDNEYELWICGAGGIQTIVEKCAEEDKRIKYMGFLSKDEISLLQVKCDLLVNPSSGKDEYTKYSFPSKTMEYLLSGSKVVMYELAGIPKKYYEYIKTVNGESTENLRRALIDACDDMEFYREKSFQQISWVSTEKSFNKQVEKLNTILNKEM